MASAMDRPSGGDALEESGDEDARAAGGDELAPVEAGNCNCHMIMATTPTSKPAAARPARALENLFNP